jgi:hypothetical protein
MNDLSQRPRPDDTAWSELEQAFFAAAPPDDPEPVPEPLRFDDDTPPTPARVRPWTRYLEILPSVRWAMARFVAALAGRRLDTQIVAAALALTALIAALASHGHAPVATLPAPASCSDACLSPRDPTLIAFECAAVIDLEADLRSQYCCL